MASISEMTMGNHEQDEETPGTYHVVKRGDTLSKLAKHYYGDATLYGYIFDANTHILDNPNHIEIGQELFIPDLDAEDEDEDEDYEDEE